MYKKQKGALRGFAHSAIWVWAATRAKATLVTFSTAGVFAGSGTVLGGGSGIMIGSGSNTLTLTFFGINPASTVNPGTTFTFASLGMIHTASTGSGATIGSPLTLTINISQLF